MRRLYKKTENHCRRNRWGDQDCLAVAERILPAAESYERFGSVTSFSSTPWPLHSGHEFRPVVNHYEFPS